MKLVRSVHLNPFLIFLIPLVDVCFLLLLLFLVSSTFLLHPGISVNLPILEVHAGAAKKSHNRQHHHWTLSPGLLSRSADKTRGTRAAPCNKTTPQTDQSSSRRIV